MKFVVLTPVTMDRPYRPGDQIEMPESDARPLLDADVIRHTDGDEEPLPGGVTLKPSVDVVFRILRLARTVAELVAEGDRGNFTKAGNLRITSVVSASGYSDVSMNEVDIIAKWQQDPDKASEDYGWPDPRPKPGSDQE